MTSAIMLACIIILPIALITLLRVNATLVFLSLCLGDVLSQFVASDANSFTSFFTTTHATANLHPTDSTWKLILLLLPVLITVGIMFHTVKGNSKMIVNMLPAASVGLVGALLVVPLLPAAAAQDIINSTLWDQLTRAQSLVVGISALACLCVLWMQRPKTGSGKHGKHAS